MSELGEHAKIIVGEGARQSVDVMAAKILELAVRTTHVTQDVVREGYYLSDVEFRRHPAAIELNVVDHASVSWLTAGDARFSLGISALAGAAPTSESPRDYHQQPVESIVIRGGYLEAMMADEVDGEGAASSLEEPQPPLTIEFSSGDDLGRYATLEKMSEAELDEAVKALILSFVIRYGLYDLVPEDEAWHDTHLTAEQHDEWLFLKGMNHPEADTYPDGWPDESIEPDWPTDEPSASELESQAAWQHEHLN